MDVRVFRWKNQGGGRNIGREGRAGPEKEKRVWKVGEGAETRGFGGDERSKSGSKRRWAGMTKGMYVRLLSSSKNPMELARESLARSWDDLVRLASTMGDLDVDVWVFSRGDPAEVDFHLLSEEDGERRCFPITKYGREA